MFITDYGCTDEFEYFRLDIKSLVDPWSIRSTKYAMGL